MKEIKSIKDLVHGHKCLGAILKEDRHIIGGKFEEQLSCPFHGADNKPSARYYPETDTLYCWKCQESWDAFSYVMKKKDLRFLDSIEFIVGKFKLDLSKLPDTDSKIKDELVVNKAEVKLDKKSLVLSKMEEKIRDLKNRIPFEKYNKLAFGFLIMKSSGSKDTFIKKCELLIKEIKQIG